MSNLGFVLTADTSTLLARMVEAGSVTDREAKKMQRSLQFVSDQLKVMNGAQKSANDAVAGLEPAGKHMETFGFQTAAAKRELLVLTHELSQGNYSRFGGSLLVLAERTNAMELAFSGAGVAIGLVGGVIAAFAAAAVLGAHEQEEFRKSLIATGNAAGITSSSFDALAKNAAKATESSIGSSKTALQALVSTGRIGQMSIEGATQATLLMEKLTGQSADEIAKDFGKMSDGVAKWAQEHNKQLHYLTGAQFSYIKGLEDQGKLEQAEAENFRLLTGRIKEVNPHLSYMAERWHWLGLEASSAWDLMKGVTKTQTTAEQIDAVQKKIDGLTRPKAGENAYADLNYKVRSEALRQELYLLQEKQKLENKSADLQAKVAAQAEKDIAKQMSAKPGKPGPGYPGGMGPMTFDEMWPAANISAITKWQADNASAQAVFLKGERDFYNSLDAIQHDEAAKWIEDQAKLIKKSQEQEKSFNDWFQKFDEKERAKNMPFSEARDTAIGKYLDGIGDQTKRAEELVNGSFTRMEDAIVTFAKTGKLSFSDLFGFMAEEYLRNMIRMGEKKLLTDESGGFVGFGSLLSSIGGLFSGNSHANGLDYVPYDGYPAILHKGERVQTAVEASGGGGRGGVAVDASINGLNVGAGVSLPQVRAVVNQALAGQYAQITRQMRQGVLS